MVSHWDTVCLERLFLIELLNQNTLMLFHIGLSLFTYAVCFIETLYVIQLVWLDRNLKKHKTYTKRFSLSSLGLVLVLLVLVIGDWAGEEKG